MIARMSRSFLLARMNLRRARGQAAALVALMFLAALMLNLWLMLATDYRRNFDRCHDRLNAEHVTLSVDGDGEELRELLRKTMEEDRRTDCYFLGDAMHMVGLFEYNGGEVNSWFLFLEKEEALSCPVGRVEIVEEGGLTSGIYMPVLYRSESIDIGKTVKISIGSNEVEYTVCGFYNSAMAGSHNCSMCELILTEDKYRELKEAGYAAGATLCSVRLRDREESASYEAMLKNAVSSGYPQANMASNSYELVAQSRYISQMICAGILSAVSLFILLIVLVVTASNIVNYIQENMKNLGALKAVGYTSRQLIGTLLMQFLGLSLTAAAVGAGVSYGLFPGINAMMVAQTGIPYQCRFLPLPFLATLLVSGGTVALTVWLSARRIRRIEPIVALRQGLQTHNFRRNPVPLEHTGAPLPLALALKTTLSGVKHNVTVCITMLVLSLVVVFSGLMIRNVILDMTPFLNMIVGEVADSCISINRETEEAFLREMHTDRQVEKVYLYTSAEVRHVGGSGLVATMSEDFSGVNNQDVVFRGRFPRYDNEIAVAAKYAREYGLRIGNEIVLTANGKEAAYIVSGYTQITNNLGKDCLLTRAGYERLGQLQHASYYLNLADSTNIDDFNARVKERFGNAVNVTINIDSTVKGASSVYISLMSVLVLAVLVLSVVVIAFVLYLLVRTMLTNKKRDYGILKALGYTTGQLILQTALTFMPAILVSTAAGVALCCLIINPLTALFLSSIGIVKCTFLVPVGLITAEAAGLIVFAFCIACLLSLKIRKIAPRALLTDE